MSSESPRRDLLDLLSRLGEVKELNSFYLVGGTALSILLEHRVSNDIGLFTSKDFFPDIIISALQKIGVVKNITIDEAVVRLTLDSIPIDLVRFPYPELEPPLKINNINVLRLPDLAAMKLNAISRRGRKRDFFDIYFLLERYTASPKEFPKMPEARSSMSPLGTRRSLRRRRGETTYTPKYNGRVAFQSKNISLLDTL